MPGPSERHRLFFALLPDARVLGDLLRAAEALKRDHEPRGRWIPPERLHLTLAFLGDFPAMNTDVVESALRIGEQLKKPAFDLVLDSASSFPGRRPPWVLRCEQSAELSSLRAALEEALNAAGFHRAAAENFVPHVTVLRDGDKPLETVRITHISWPVREFALMHSRMGPVREYLVLRRWASR